MKSGNEFSIKKAELKPEELQAYFEGKEVRGAISHNVEVALGSEVVENKEGIFQFEEFSRLFTFDGSLKTKQSPATGHYKDFFSNEDRLTKKSDDYILRGPNYLVSIDPALEVRQKLHILKEDFLAAVDALSLDGGDISKENYIEQSATLDYLKNSSITLLNALVHPEKIGNFRLDDEEYQDARDIAADLAKCTTQAYYAHLIGSGESYAAAMAKIVDTYERVDSLSKYLESQYFEGIFSSRFFTRPEAGHPLIIAASAFNAARNIRPQPDTVIGLPAGGTELAFAQCFAYEILLKHSPDLLLVPLSLHSVKDTFGTNEIKRDEFGSFLESAAGMLRSKNLLIVEDNSSTGRTIQMLHDTLTELIGSQKITVSVAEADLIRSTIDRDSERRTHIASNLVYAQAVNILPVSRVIQPKVDLKAMAEEKRIASKYNARLESAQTPEEQLLYRSFVHMCENPTQGVLDSLNDENAIREFRYTFLSNFYATPVVYGGHTYPSVENAYQAQKFSGDVLEQVSSECMDEINEALRARGRLVGFENARDIFSNEMLSSGNAKVVADILRDYGYVQSDWDDRKMLLMADFLLQKYKNPDLAQRLIDTNNKYLVEGNTWNDTLWGVSGGRGRNLLGIMLMEVRDQLQKER